MKEPTQVTYHEALKNYYHKTKAHIFPNILYKIEGELDIIQKYDQLKSPVVKKDDALEKLILIIFVQTIRAIVITLLFIFVLNEVLKLDVDFSIKNILLIGILIMAWKVEFRFIKLKSEQS